MTTGRLTKLLSQALKFIKISLVLLLVLNLLLDTLENADGGRVVVHATRSAECGLDDRGRRDEVVGEAVVEPALHLKEVLGLLEESDVALRKGLKSLLVVGAAVADKGGRERETADRGGGASTEERGDQLGTHGGDSDDDGGGEGRGETLGGDGRTKMPPG